MISPKLLVLLQNFSKHNRDSFEKYLQSSFHNENQDLINLLKIINLQLSKPNIDVKQNSQLDKKIVWKKIKENAPYQDEQMRRMSSDLIKKTYQFLAYNEFKKNPMDELIYLLPTINTPNLNKHFAGVNRQLELIQKKSKLKNADYHFSKYKLNLQQYINVEKNTPSIPNFDFLEKADYHLDAYYIFNKLKKIVLTSMNHVLKPISTLHQ